MTEKKYLKLGFNTKNLFLLMSIIGVQNTYADLIKDSDSSIYLRNFYIDRSFDRVDRSDVGSWTQAISGKFKSGYTDTPVQVGLDLTAQYAFRLNDHNAERFDSIIPYDNTKGEQYNDYAKYGATLKLKYKNTELKVGELYPMTPVAFIDDSRQLVTSYAGAMIESKEIKNLKISAGRLTRINAREDDKYRKISLFTGQASSNPNAKGSDGLNFIGLDYNFTSKVSGSYWFGQLEDIYQQNYAKLAYSTVVGDTKVTVDGRYFNNKEDGDAFYGKIDSQSYGLMTTIQTGGHTFATGARKNEGRGTFPTLTGYAPQPYLHAWSNLGFVSPEEVMWHVLYTYSFKGLGINGLSTTFRYLHGDNIYRAGLSDNTEIEKSLLVSYVIPEGKFKGLGFQWANIHTDTKYDKTTTNPGAKWQENRLIATYTYKF